MAGFQKLDKKQVPQVVGLGALSVGLFGYFAFKMITPTVSAAPTIRATPAAGGAAASPATETATAASGAGTTAGKSGDGTGAAVMADSPPPTPGMRDPFVAPVLTASTPAPAPGPGPAPAKPPTQMAMAGPAAGDSGLHLPFAPPLPPGGGHMPGFSPQGNPTTAGLSPMPISPSTATPPPWTVTGVLQSGRSNVAILRDGATRRFAHTGDLVGGEFRVIDVTRQFVVLRHGSRHYLLPLGGAKASAAKPDTPAFGAEATNLPAAQPGGSAAMTVGTLPDAQPGGTTPPPTALPSVPSEATLNTLQQLAGK